jgi:SAM-dependent methyltransferase
MEWFKKTYFSRTRPVKTILDVGSYCVDGHQSYHQIFPGEQFRYTGLDMTSGPNVDIVVKQAYKWNEIEDNSFDAVISGQTFEHIEFPWLTIKEMTRIVKQEGIICIIAPNGPGLHRYPVDCWRYYSDGMIALARWAGLEILHVSTNMAPENAPATWYGGWQDCMLVARKPAAKIEPMDTGTYKCVPVDLESINSGFIELKQQPYSGKIKFKKIVKCFIPYGIIKIRQMIKNSQEGILPFRRPEEPEEAAAEAPHDMGKFRNVIGTEGTDQLPAQIED